MLHVSQRGPKDCGVAVAAMVAGVRYEVVLDRWFGGLTVESGVTVSALWRVLEDITQVEWQVSTPVGPRPQVCDYPFPDWPTALVIEGGRSRSHYIAVERELVYDPSFPVPFPQYGYPNAACRVRT